MELAFLDLETTGVSAASDRIVEIAIVRVCGDVETAWSSLVQPGVPVGASQRVHGLSDDAVAGAPTLAALRGEIGERLAGATLVAHRAAFDLGFLAAAAARGEIEPVASEAIDTAPIADLVLGESGLAAVARRIGGRPPQHRALPDALAAADALAACVEALGPVDSGDLVALSRPAASMRPAVAAVLEVGRKVGLVYRPASGRAHEDVLEVESIAPPYVTGVLEKKGVRRVLRGDRIVRAWVGERPSLRFF